MALFEKIFHFQALAVRFSPGHSDATLPKPCLFDFLEASSRQGFRLQACALGLPFLCAGQFIVDSCEE